MRNDLRRVQYASRRKVLINSLGGRCKLCGSTDNLIFDHIDPSTKIMNGSQILQANPHSRIYKLEIDKLQVLCKSCHDGKSGEEHKSNSRPHGYNNTYKYGCRCQECRNAHAKARANRLDRLFRW